MFSHKGHIGITIPSDTPFINDPSNPDELGVVISTQNVLITQEAKDHIKLHHTHVGGSFSPFMLTKHAEEIHEQYGKSSIGILGHADKVYMGEEMILGRDCDLSVLDDCEVTADPAPEDFVAAVEKMLGSH